VKFDDQEQKGIRQYLLGQLSQEDSAELEQRLLGESSFYDEVLIAEDELIDQYLRDELSLPDRASFETHFLQTAERQQKARFARVLRKYVLAHQPALEESPTLNGSSERSGDKRHFFSFLFPQNRALAFSLACALLLVIFAGAWLVISNLRQQKSPQAIFAVEITPGLTREGGEQKRFAIPPSSDAVQLQLDLSEDQYVSYEAALQDAEGKTLITRSKLKAQSSNGRQAVLFEVAPSLLHPGDYVVKLRGITANGGSESVSSYSFRVVSR
jgi:anti-sigma factor RsiW